MTAFTTTPRQTDHGGELDRLLDTNVATMSSLEAQIRGEVDIQISTARAYPRDIRKCRRMAESLATLDDDVAASCFYVLERGDKKIDGASVRFAEIVAYAWGHMRYESRMIEEGERFIVVKGSAWDLESNVQASAEVRRRITYKDGNRYNDDMIVVTANAAASIALRNAILRVVPPVLTKPVYDAARATARGDLATLGTRRKTMLTWFGELGIDADRVCGWLGVPNEEAIGLDELLTLRGVATSIKAGDITAAAAFAPSGQERPAERSAIQAVNDAVASSGDAQAAPPASSDAPERSAAGVESEIETLAEQELADAAANTDPEPGDEPALPDPDAMPPVGRKCYDDVVAAFREQGEIENVELHVQRLILSLGLGPLLDSQNDRRKLRAQKPKPPLPDETD